MISRTWRQRGAGVCDAFSLVEIVIAISIVAFSMVAIIGMMSVSMAVHQDSANDSVLTLMTESALQEVNNAANENTGNAGFSSLATTYTSANPGYIYFDVNGQITGDGSSSSYEVSTASSPNASGIPATSAATTYPANTVYQCAITIAAPTGTNYPYLLTTATNLSLLEIKLTFTWPVGAPGPAAAANPTATPRTRVVTTTIANPN